MLSSARSEEENFGEDPGEAEYIEVLIGDDSGGAHADVHRITRHECPAPLRRTRRVCRRT